MPSDREKLNAMTLETMMLAETVWSKRRFVSYEMRELGLVHLREMAKTMLDNCEPMPEDKLNRWLGWMQCAICSWGSPGATIVAMKDINRRHSA